MLLSGSAALAADLRTVTLGVDHMTCAASPITVRKALSQVAGVSASVLFTEADARRGVRPSQTGGVTQACCECPGGNEAVTKTYDLYCRSGRQRAVRAENRHGPGTG
jgi:hypothetical protein